MCFAGVNPLRYVNVLLWLCGCLPLVAADLLFKVAKCNETVYKLLSSDVSGSIARNTTLFAQPPHLPYPFSAVLTTKGCNLLCGEAAASGPPVDSECAPRLFQWVFPVLLLVGSVPTLLLPRRMWAARLWTLTRAIGDPFDTILSIAWTLKKLAHSAREGAAARATVAGNQATVTGNQDAEADRLARAFGVVVRAVVEWEGSDGQFNTPERAREWLEALVNSGMSTKGVKISEVETAVSLAAAEVLDNATPHMWRAWASLAAFTIGVVIAMIPQASPTPSGGMLAAVLTLSPLLLVVLTSSAIGVVGSWYQLGRTLEVLVATIGGTEEGPSKGLRGLGKGLKSRKRRVESAVYQPRKWEVGWLRLPTQVLPFTLPVPICLAGAAGALGAPPALFNDRIWVLVGILVAWLLSFGFTTLVTLLLRPLKKSRGKDWKWLQNDQLEWGLIAAKDVAVAAYVQASLAGITCGWMADCEIWDAHYQSRGGEGRVITSPIDDFYTNSHKLYPALVAFCMGLNLVWYFCMTRWWFRGAVFVLSWEEKEIEDILSSD